MRIEKNYKVEYAHRLPDHKRHCKFLHGHSGKVCVVFDGQINPSTGMIIDFGEFVWLGCIIEEFDHALVLQKSDRLLHYLLAGIDENKIGPLRLVTLDGPPTAENICLFIWTTIKSNQGYQDLHKKLWNDTGFELHSVTFEETEGNAVTTGG
jgi:6-pyruvoyltetrahydropterin/6-carboxytetrahydropterin synthase